MRWLGSTLIALTACGVSAPFVGLDEVRPRLTLDDTVEVEQLANGLKVAVVTDDRTNLVTIDVRYEVGAADDPRGHEGLAHYAEHVMWEAGVRPPNAPSLASATLAANAFTTHSSTHFSSIALDAELDRALEIEARRMEVPCITLPEAMLSRERDVVVQELAVRAQQSPAMDGLAAAVWGAAHPYGRSAGGHAFADAPITELCAFVSGRYVPRNATLVVTGRIPADVRAKIRARFERIPDRQPPSRSVLPRGRLDHAGPLTVAGLQRPTAMLVIPVPPEGGDDDGRVELAVRLIRGLLEYDGIGGAEAFVLGDHRARVIVAYVEVGHADQLDAMARRMARAVATRLRYDLSGVSRAARTALAATFDRLWGRGARLAEQVATTATPRLYRELAQVERVSASGLAAFLARRPVHRITLVPGGRSPVNVQIANLPTRTHQLDVPRELGADRGEPLRIPTSRVDRQVIDYRLANGVRVVLAPDPRSIAVDARLVLAAGTDHEPAPGVATDAARRLQPSDGWADGAYEHRLVRWYHDTIGDRPTVEVGPRATAFRVRGFGVAADWHVWNLAWTVLHGEYVARPTRRFAGRTPTPALEPPSPQRVLARALGRALDAPAPPPRATLEAYRRIAYQPDRATLIVSGGFDLAAMRTQIDRLFGAWRAPTPTARLAVRPAVAAPPRTPRYFAIEDRAALSTQVVIAYALGDEGEPLALAARDTLAAMLEDRMRIVREGLGVSYGVHGKAGEQVVLLAGDLRTPHVSRALAAIDSELGRLATGGDELSEDFSRARRWVLGRALADPSGASEHAERLTQRITNHAALDDHDTAVAAVRTLTLDEVVAAARRLRPERRIVIVRGPRAAIETAFATLDVDRSVIEWTLPE